MQTQQALISFSGSKLELEAILTTRQIREAHKQQVEWLTEAILRGEAEEQE